jgi:hypothetical protein
VKVAIVTLSDSEIESGEDSAPSLSIEERYPTHQEYVDIVKHAVDERVKEGFLLSEDGDAYLEAAKKKNPLDPSVVIEPLVTAGRED